MHRPIGMLTWLLENRLAAFEKKYDYDAGYMRELLAVDRRAFFAFARAARLSRYRKDVPADVGYAAGLTGTIAEDCGPCTQLGVTMALADGVAPATLAAVVRGDLAALPEPVALGVRFARAVLAHAPEADALREDIVRRWGPRALVSLAFRGDDGAGVPDAQVRARPRPGVPARRGVRRAGRGRESGVTDDAAATFEPHRRYLAGVAYRMLGAVSEAEDVVQDAFLRWRGAPRAEVADPRAYLARVVTRLCLDRLKSARARRELYPGTWLPEPLPEPFVAAPADVADDVSVALLMTLERLSPLERAAFLLHDVFDMDYAAIADALDRSEAACRQLAARGREHVREQRPRFQPSRDAELRLLGAVAAAMSTGDVDALAEVLAEDAVLYSDGGGKRAAALNPIFGRAKILRFLHGVKRKRALPAPAQVRLARLNGLPGFVLDLDEGVETIALAASGDHIAAIYIVRNPDKLRHLSA